MQDKFNINFTYKNNFSANDANLIEKIDIPYRDIIKYFPGDLRNDESFLNLISKLIYFFGKILSQKTEYIFSIYHLQLSLFREWIDFRSLKALIARLLFFLNKIQFTNYSE